MYTFDNVSLIQDGKRWFPVMGEIHYSRYPRQYWKESLLKMKAGGVDVASTYVIWIHHEEIENQYDFSGDRDLHAFVETCRQCKIKLWLRIGPWIHGEVRNGGFPDWLLKKDFEVRTNDERYFSTVEKWYKKIYEQVKDYFYNEKNPENPIIGVQIENEFGHCGGLYDETGEIHMQRLTKIAREIGFTVPFYTATGWGGARTGGLIPVMGGYCDAPWDPRTTEIEPSGNYIFTYERNDHNIGSDYGLGEGITFDVTKFPYLTAELGGGLQMTKHRRTVATAGDIGAVSLVKIGSGVNLLGFYMYHGGTNPDGKLTTLQESKATGYPNDLPEKSYDFNAPVREFGQIAPVFKELKLLFYFVHDFGSELCDLPAVIPTENPLKPENLTDLRFAYRSDGKKGYVFVNNYVRLRKMQEHRDVAFPLPDKSGSLPALTVHDGEYFFMPFNMTYSGVKIKSAECAPLCKVFVTENCGSENREITVFYASDFSLRTRDFFVFEDEKNVSDVPFLVLSRKNAFNLWKICKNGCGDRLIISENPVIQDEEGKISVTGRGQCSFYVYPDFKKAPAGFVKSGVKNMNIDEQGKEFVFTEYTFENVSSDTSASSGAVTISAARVSSESGVSSVADRKIFHIDCSALINDYKARKEKECLSDCFVKLFYRGESARLYAITEGKKVLIADNFFSGVENPWEIGLKRFIDSGVDFVKLELEVFALTSENIKGIYFEKEIALENGCLCVLDSINAEYEWMREIG